jgi:hypothetical protein
MPPPPVGVLWSQRDTSPESRDPVVSLMNELKQWEDQGKPKDVFDQTVTQTAAAESYALPEEMARQQTNMGTCIPGRGMVGVQKQEMDDLDTKFAAMKTFADLPRTLAETDLTTLDSAALARKRVVAFAPAYPLWSEDSGKMRAVRVPRGMSIKFDKATQRFEIPDNTRFYKTFLKKITLRDGREVWRKIETRLIVARKPEGDQPVESVALFASYAWNEEETEATLVEDRLHDNTPFADRMFTYVVDQPRYDKLVADPAKAKDLERQLAREENKGIVRHYIIRGGSAASSATWAARRPTSSWGSPPCRSAAAPRARPASTRRQAPTS